jgi:hypothetical protein
MKKLSFAALFAALAVLSLAAQEVTDTGALTADFRRLGSVGE